MHSKAELDQLAKLTGLERLRVSICPVKDLLPDDDARIFTQVTHPPPTVDCALYYLLFFCFGLVFVFAVFRVQICVKTLSFLIEHT